MATRSLRFVIDTENGRLLPGFRSIVSTLTPKFTVGDQVPVEVYLAKGSGVTLQEVSFPAGAIVRLALGRINESPTAGTWSLTYGGDTTADLAYNATPAQVQTALNALASITAAGGVTVEKVGDAYSIAFNTAGDRTAVSGSAGTLVPLSAVSIQTLQEGSVSQAEVILLQVKVRPIALCETFTDTPAPTIARSGQSYAITGQVKSGSYTLSVTYDGDTKETVQIAYNASVSTIEAAILQALVFLGWPQGTDAKPVRVTQTDSQSWVVSYWDGGSYLSGVNGANLIGYAGKVGTLSLATTEALAFIGSDTSARGVMEVEVEVAGERQTLVQANTDITGDLILAGTFEPTSLEEALSEAVANARFVRRDADQTLDATSKDQIWENLLGATSPTGVNLVGAILAASSPSAANPLATIADTGNPFNQDLNTTNSAVFAGLDVDGLAKAESFAINDGTADLLTISAAGVITTLADANLGNILTSGTVSISGPGMDTVLAQDSLSFQGNAVLTPSDLTLTDGLSTLGLNPTAGLVINSSLVLSTSDLVLTDGVNNISLTAAAGLTFTSANALSDTIYSAGTNASTGKTHIDTADYPDEVRVVINGITYAMPARVI